MTDHGIVVAYEVRWTWHGEREAIVLLTTTGPSTWR